MNVECCADSSERLPSGHLVRNAVLIAVCFILGCDARIETFLPNRVFSLSLEKTRGTSAERATEDARRVVQELYGTPDDPSWPLPDNNLADLQNLVRSSGPVSSEKDGTHLGFVPRALCCLSCTRGERSGSCECFSESLPTGFPTRRFQVEIHRAGKEANP